MYRAARTCERQDQQKVVRALRTPPTEGADVGLLGPWSALTRVGRQAPPAPCLFRMLAVSLPASLLCCDPSRGLHGAEQKLVPCSSVSQTMSRIIWYLVIATKHRNKECMYLGPWHYRRHWNPPSWEMLSALLGEHGTRSQVTKGGDEAQRAR